MTARRAAVGVANHNGWAVLVSVALEEGRPVVLDRRKVALIDDDLPPMPYEHHLPKLPLDEAAGLIVRVRASAANHARAAFETLRADLAPAHDLIAAALRPSVFGRLPDDLAEVLAYKPMIYAADGMLYQEVLEAAAHAAGLAVLAHDKGVEFDMAGRALACDAEEAKALIQDLKAQIGAPWSEEHRRAAAAALGALTAA